jgi:hypothetical protein
MGKIRIRDEKNLYPGSGINIPDPRHRTRNKLYSKKNFGKGIYIIKLSIFVEKLSNFIRFFTVNFTPG